MATGKRIQKVSVAALVAILCAGCTEQPAEYRSAEDFVEDTVALDAKLVACQKDRRAAVRDPECKAARQAANRVAMAEDAARRQRLEAESAAQLSRLRRAREAEDRVEAERERELIKTAEAKIAAGQPLSSAEARAIGIDPDNSVLVNPDVGEDPDE